LVSQPPLETVVSIAVLSGDTISVPPLLTVVLLAGRRATRSRCRSAQAVIGSVGGQRQQRLEL
jgi:hypothetical protein